MCCASLPETVRTARPAAATLSADNAAIRLALAAATKIDVLKNAFIRNKF